MRLNFLYLQSNENHVKNQVKIKPRIRRNSSKIQAGFGRNSSEIQAKFKQDSSKIQAKNQAEFKKKSSTKSYKMLQDDIKRQTTERKTK